MNIVSYNCQNFKANRLTVENLINSHEICFFIEHWLGSNEDYLFNNICSNNSILFKADYDNECDRKGRPFGGTCWVVHNSLRVVDHLELSQSVSKITVEGSSIGRVTLLGVWQPFDDSSHVKLGLLHSTISILENELELDMYPTLIMGDFNADYFNRNKRFDKIFKKFLDKMKLVDAAQFFGLGSKATYHKGKYSATLDHICSSAKVMEYITRVNVLELSSDCSDHKPISCSLDLPKTLLSNECIMEDLAKVHKFPWKNDFFKEQYHSLLIQLAENLMMDCISLPNCSNPILLIDSIHRRLPHIMLKAAREAEKVTGSRTRNGLIRGRFVHCRHSPEILSTISELKLMHGGKSEAEREQVARLKRRLRFLQRRSIFDCERHESNVVDRLLRDDRQTFWKRVKSARFRARKRAKIINSKPKPNEFSDFYERLFSHNDRQSNSWHRRIEQVVSIYVSSANNYYDSLPFSYSEINSMFF